MKSQFRKDAPGKLRGTCRFLDDYSPPGLLYGYLVYSTVDNGVIKKIDLPQEFNPEDFIIVNSNDIPGCNIVPEPVSDQPFMADSSVSHYGQVIMGVAHPDRAILKKFVSTVKIEYEEKKAVTDTKECLDNKALRFGEVMHLKCKRKQNSGKSFKKREIYYTQHQEQAYLEPQGMLAEFDPKTSIMKITGTMQCPFFVKEAVENILGNSAEKVIVETSEGIGGAFGGKEDFPSLLAGITSLLSWKAQKPVKIVLDRKDDLLITTKRHPSRIEIYSEIDEESAEIMNMEIDYRLDAGAYQTLSPVVLHRGILHATGGYRIGNAELTGALHRSNTPPNGAFRGFGAPQAIFAVESHLDSLATCLGMSPLEIRKINVLRKGDGFPTSQVIKEDHLYDCLIRAAELSDYERKRTEFEKYNKNHHLKKGIGLVLGLHGGGYTGNGEKVLNSQVRIDLESSGKVSIYVANVEMGQGAHTTLAEMVNEIFRLPLDKVNVILPDTSRTPNSGPTVASRTIYIVGSLLQKLAFRIKEELGFSDLEKFVALNQSDFPKSFSAVFQPDEADYFDDKTNQGVAYHDYSWAAGVVEISYEPDLYQIGITKSWNVLDVGKVINPAIAEGQVYGGVTQALGWALSEDIYKKGYSRLRGFTDYVLPSSFDIPEIHVEFIHTDSATAKGLGEIPMDYPAAAVRNAFFQITGITVNSLPLSPERIFHHYQESNS